MPGSPSLRDSDPIAFIASVSSLTSRDIDDLRACTTEDLAVLIRTYIDSGAVENYGVWVEIGNALKNLGPYVALAESILAIVVPLLAKASS